MEVLLSFYVPMHLPSVVNLRENWRKRAKRAASQREDITLYWLSLARQYAFGERLKSQPLIVKLTRHGRKELDDDNLRSALKAVRDGIAECLGIDDRDPRVRWDYDQVFPHAGGVRVDIGVSADRVESNPNDDRLDEHAPIVRRREKETECPSAL
jgi:hypothetical protein